MFYNHRSSQENFELIMEDMGKFRTKLQKEIELLKEQNDIKSIEKLAPLLLESIKLSVWKDSGVYASDRLRVRIDGSEAIFKLIKEQPAVKCEVPQYRNYGDYLNFLIIDIDEDSEQKNKELYAGFIDILASIDEPIHQENIKNAKKNGETKQALFALLVRIGISSSYYGYSSKRSSKKTEQHYNFSSEIGGQIPTYYQESKITDLKKTLVNQFAELYDREIKKIRDVRLNKEREESERLANKKLALLLAKYDLSLEQEWSDLLDTIIEKNKYLKLAHFLLKNRNDWNDGDWYARRGLDSFAIETEEDQHIYDNISRYTGENWDMDGRVFRDCEFNYDVLFAKANEQNGDLYRDYETVRENVEE